MRQLFGINVDIKNSANISGILCSPASKTSRSTLYGQFFSNFYEQIIQSGREALPSFPLNKKYPTFGSIKALQNKEALKQQGKENKRFV